VNLYADKKCHTGFYGKFTGMLPTNMLKTVFLFGCETKKKRSMIFGLHTRIELGIVLVDHMFWLLLQTSSFLASNIHA